MIKRIIITILVMGCLFTATYHAVSGKTTSTDLVTVRLSDRTATVYNIVRQPEIQTGSVGAHVLWAEFVQFDPPNDIIDSDLFYAHLPTGQVTRLTATQGSVGEYVLAVGTDNHAYIAWSEDTLTDEEHDLFFWKTGMVSPIHLSDTNLTTLNADHIYLVLDQANEAHIFWSEVVEETFTAKIFHWSESNGVVVLTDGEPGFFGTNVVRVYGVAVHNNVIHVLWEEPVSKGVQLFHWNSQTQTPVNLNTEGIDGDSDLSGLFINESGTLHVVWRHDPYFVQDIRLYHWDSTNGQSHLITEDGSYRILLQDGNGNAHVLEDDDGVTYHWDSVNQTLQAIPQTADYILNILYGNGREGNHIHLAWANEDSNWPGHLNDVFYWRSDMAEPINVTDHAAGPADVTQIQFTVDETNTAHVLWGEGEEYYYYNQMDTITQVLSGTLRLPPGMTMPRIRPDRAHFGDIIVGTGGAAYVLFNSSENNTLSPYFLWQSDTNSAVAVPAVYGVTSPDLRMLWLDSAGTLHAAWKDNSLAGEEFSNLHYWDPIRGSQDLTDNSETSGSIGESDVTAVSDPVGNVYIIWREFSSIADKYEVYAAYTPIEYSHFIYLPTVQR